jgi:hypothetical protein
MIDKQFKCGICGAVNLVRAPLVTPWPSIVAAIAKLIGGPVDGNLVEHVRAMVDGAANVIRERDEKEAQVRDLVFVRQELERDLRAEVARVRQAHDERDHYAAKLEEALQLAVTREKERDAARENHLKVMHERDAAVRLAQDAGAELAYIINERGHDCCETPKNLALRQTIRDLATPKALCAGCGGSERLADHPCPACSP